ncbi:MAG: molybdopterin-dependent oxidoreductase [Actinomycetota bacterium]
MTTTTKPQRVQRLVHQLPPVHLEAEVPTDPRWTLAVDGLVARQLVLDIDDLKTLGGREVALDFHCVWGWSRKAARWTGVTVGRVLDEAGIAPDATVVTVACVVPPYASCVRLADVREGVIAWGLDGGDIPAENGGPLRFVQPPWLWGYKGVKWVGRLTAGDRFVPGFWEEKVGNPEGRVPAEVLAPFATGEDA